MNHDLFSLAGRCALVTGGSRGIGRMIAAGFLAQGARVYISARKAEACDRTARRAVVARHLRLAARRHLDARRREGARRRVRASRAGARHPRQQCRRGLGRVVRHVPREGLGQGRRPEPEDAVLPDAGAAGPLRKAASADAAGQGHQHRLDRRHLGQPAGDLFVRGEQGRPDPADAANGAAPGQGQHRRQRDRARRLRLRHEPRRARPRRRRSRRAFRPAASASTTTWPAPRSTSLRAPATTWSARRWSSTAA